MVLDNIIPVVAGVLVELGVKVHSTVHQRVVQDFAVIYSVIHYIGEVVEADQVIVYMEVGEVLVGVVVEQLDQLIM